MSPDAVLPPSEVSTLSVESLKEPRLSLTLTLLVLIIVTIVSCIRFDMQISEIRFS